MRRLGLVVIPLLILSLVVGAVGCKSSGGAQLTPTAVPTQTAEVTATPAPTSTSSDIATFLTLVNRGMPTSNPVYRGVLPDTSDTLSFSSLVRTLVAREDLSGYALVDALRAVPRVSAFSEDGGYQDFNDISALLLSLSDDELSQYGLDNPYGSRYIPTEFITFPAGAPEPHYFINVRVILCANDDGSGGAASSNAVTASFMKQVIDVANSIYDDAGIWLTYNPETDFETVESTMVNMDFTVPADINYYSDSNTPPLSEAEIKALAQEHEDARQSLARQHRGEMVILCTDGNELVYEENDDPTLSRWKMQSRGYAFSCEKCEFVAMPTQQGDAQDWGRLLAHEGGHYYHQNHTFVEVLLTAEENANGNLSFSDRAGILIDRALQWIADYVSHGHSPYDGLNVFNGDGLSDTPPDPGPQFWYYVTGDADACGATAALKIDVPLGVTTQSYTFQPDRGNVVSYFFRCFGIPQHYSPMQIADMRKSLEQENRWHLIGTQMRMKAIDTHVLNNQVYYNAVWQPGTSNDVAVFGWAYDDFLTEATDMLNNGWSMTQLDSFVLNGEVYFNAVWQPGASNDYAVLGWAFTDFVDECNVQNAAGMRLKLLDTYVVNNQVYYNAVWQPGNLDEPAVFGWAYDDFLNEANARTSSGWDLKILNSYVLNGQAYYDAVWQSGTSDEYAVLGWAYDDFLAESNDKWNEGWRTELLNSYVLNGEVYYNAVWLPGTSDDYAVYGWTFTDFLNKYDQIW